MNAYAKLRILTGFNNPCDAIVPDVNVNNKGMMGFVIGIKFGFDLNEKRKKKGAGDED